MRATHIVGGVSLRPAVPVLVPGTRDGGKLSKPDTASVVLVLWLAIRVVVWACSNELGTDSGKDGGCVAGSLTHRKLVMGSFDAETRWPNEWSISAQGAICGDSAGKMVATTISQLE